MKAHATELFQELPPGVEDIVEVFSSDKMTILKARNVFSEPKGFGCYKFLLPSKYMPPILVEKKKYHLQQKKIFPLNPDQVHMYTEEKSVKTYMPIFIKKEYIREFSHLLWKRSQLFYNNDSLDMDHHTSRLIFQFIEEAANKQAGYRFVLESLNTQIVINLLRKACSNLSYSLKSKDYHDVKVIKLTDEYLRSHLSSDFSLDDLAAFVNYSPYHFIRTFKKHTGKTPFEYLTELKIQKAKDLLSTKHCSINEVSILCGFSNRTHFSTVFKRIVGISPSSYRKLIHPTPVQ